MHQNTLKFFFLVILFFSFNVSSKTYNSFGQVGLINLPSAEIFNEQSVFLTFNKSEYAKIGTITVSPFNWLEASYFYYRPDDLFWGGKEGLFLDKGFNVKFSYKPTNKIFPTLAVGLDDFAGTGLFTKEYVAATYNFNNLKITSGIGWGKFAGGDYDISNPLKYFSDIFEFRESTSKNLDLGGTPATDLWFKGDAAIFVGIETKIKFVKNLSFKVESDPFNYYELGIVNEFGPRSLELRKKDSKFNYGLSYKYKEFGNIDLSFIKGNTLNLSFSIGFSSKNTLRKKTPFSPKIENIEHNLDQKNEFYLDLLENLNKNNLFLQTATIKNNHLSVTVDSPNIYNPIQASSRAAMVSKIIAEENDYAFKLIDVGQIKRGIEFNNIAYRPEDLVNTKQPITLTKKRSYINNISKTEYKKDEFKPILQFPIFFYNIGPDIRTHVGSPERVFFNGFGIRLNAELQLSRNTTISGAIGQNITDNFDEKASTPNTLLDPVRTEVVEYLQKSDDLYIKNLQIDRIWSIYNNIYGRVGFGLLEEMYGGATSEILYKPFRSNFAMSVEYNKVKKRDYYGRFNFLDFKNSTTHLNVAYYHPNSNILVKWSYGKYLAKDRGYTLDVSRRMPSGWKSGFYFTRTNIPPEIFGEGSFDKGFYIQIPLDTFSKTYSKDTTGFSLKTMTRDGGQKLSLQNKLIDSFYGSTLDEINENWNGFLK